MAGCVGDTLGLMHWARTRLSRLTGVWLVCHLLIMVLGAQSALRASLVTTTVVQAGCTCDHGHAGMCPMHRNRSASNRSGGSCAYHGTSDPLGAVVASLIGTAAVLTRAATPFTPLFARAVLTVSDEAVFGVSSVPDSPPPRG